MATSPAHHLGTASLSLYRNTAHGTSLDVLRGERDVTDVVRVPGDQAHWTELLGTGGAGHGEGSGTVLGRGVHILTGNHYPSKKA